VAEIKTQTDLNRQVAEATRVNAEAVINSERSMILVSHNAPAGDETWSFKFKATNHGKSPAEILSTFFLPTFLKREEELNATPIYVGTEERVLVHRDWVAPGGNIPLETYLAQAESNMVPGLWDELQSGKKKLWIYGVVRYRDRISPTVIHESRFCYFKSPAQYVNLVMDGPPGYNDHT
jgi:hypothetical protein